MSSHQVRVEWQRGEREVGSDYSRDHRWIFGGGTEVDASSAPALNGNPLLVDPEEAFVASISSCHMLWFLHLAAQDGFAVDRYRDDAVGHMEPDDRGVTWITRVELRPEISYVTEVAPTAEHVADLHERSHRLCFIANSVKTQITVS